MRLCICLANQFEETFENSPRRKILVILLRKAIQVAVLPLINFVFFPKENNIQYNATADSKSNALFYKYGIACHLNSELESNRHPQKLLQLHRLNFLARISPSVSASLIEVVAIFLLGLVMSQSRTVSVNRGPCRWSDWKSSSLSTFGKF